MANIKPTRICTVDGCERRHKGHGFCEKHYTRWRKYGTPHGGGRSYASPEESFAARTELRGDCLIWTGNRTSAGYGVININRTPYRAHRYAWEKAHGTIPEGLHVDHKNHCDPACVNVQHLRLATSAENAQNKRGASSRSKSGVRNVSPHGPGWRVDVQGDYLGTFATLELAAEVAERARKELFGEFAGKG